MGTRIVTDEKRSGHHRSAVFSDSCSAGLEKFAASNGVHA